MEKIAEKIDFWPDWIVVNGETKRIICRRCDTREQFTIPPVPNVSLKWLNLFVEQHRHCKEKE